MNKLIVHFVAMLALACAGVASAQTTTETFEGFAANATQFTSGGVTFDIVSHNIAVFDIYDGSPNSYGWNGTANDKKFIDNTRSAADGGYWGVLPDFSIKTHDGSRFTVGSFWLYPAMFNLTSLGSGGSINVTGKLAGSTVFTASASTGFNTSTAVSNGYSKIDLTTFGSANNASKTIDEIQIVTTGNFQYLALDALTWSKAAGYTISTAVTPAGAGTLTCALTSVAPGGSTTCTATTNPGYELNNIAGCNGTTSTSSSFTTGAVNANCTVTATFATALSATISKTDVSCFGGGNGTAVVAASNGVGAYSYSWAPSGGTGSIATGLAANTYTATVTDARNASVQKSVTVSQPTLLVMGPASIANGVVGVPYSQSFAASGGVPSYTYAITSGGVPGLSMSGGNLVGTPTTTGTYSITVAATDANGCPMPKTYSVQVRATVGGTVTGLASGSAFLVADGTDNAVAISGNGAFTFPTPLAQGAAYNVTIPSQPSSPQQLCSVINGGGNIGAGNVTNVAIDCKSYYTVSTAVDPPSSGTLSCATTSVLSGSTTSCTATPATGYLLDKISGCGGADSQTSPFTTGPVSGACTVTAKFVPTLAASITNTFQPSCNGGGNGSLTVTASGGFSPYNYAWSPSGGTGASATGLSAGTYTVTVKDARNNQTTANATLTYPPAIVLGSVTPPDGVNGVAYTQAFTATGGTPPLTFNITSGAVPDGLTMSSDGTLSGTPTASGTYSFNVGVQDANTCGPYSGAQNTVHIRSTIGGTVTGLASGASVVLANGADTTTVNADGTFAFPTPVDSGSTYSVAVQNVSATPPQFCSVANGSGTVGTGNVTDAAVNCASNLALGVNDDADYATYGESLDYVVGVHNPTAADASGVQLAVTLSPAFDPSATTWQCLGDGSDGVVCASSGSGASLAGTATVPAGQTALWALHGKIDPAATQGTADVAVTATYAAPWSDTDTLVIFRDGFEDVAAGAAGEVLAPSRASAVVSGSDTVTFTPAPASSRLIDTLLTLPSSSGIVRVQRLNIAKAPWLRLQWLDAGRERASAWQRASGDATLAVGAADRVILLEGRGVSAQLPLDSAHR